MRAASWTPRPAKSLPLMSASALHRRAEARLVHECPHVLQSGGGQAMLDLGFFGLGDRRHHQRIHELLFAPYVERGRVDNLVDSCTARPGLLAASTRRNCSTSR